MPVRIPPWPRLEARHGQERCVRLISNDRRHDHLHEQLRAQRWDDNARWQLTTFAQYQLGEWSGSAVEYEASGDSCSFAAGAESACSSVGRVLADDLVEVRDELWKHRDLLLPGIRQPVMALENGVRPAGKAQDTDPELLRSMLAEMLLWCAPTSSPAVVVRSTKAYKAAGGSGGEVGVQVVALVQQRAAHRVLAREVLRAERVDALQVPLDVGQPDARNRGEGTQPGHEDPGP